MMKLMPFAVMAGLLAGTAAIAVARDVPQSGPAANGRPAWFIYKQAALGSDTRRIAGCESDVAKFCSDQANDGTKLRACLKKNTAMLSATCKGTLANESDASNMTPCSHSPICAPVAANNPDGVGNGVGGYIRVEWKSVPANMGYTTDYSDKIPPGGGGAVSVAIDSKDNLWVDQRNPPGMAQLFKFSPDHKLLVTVPESVLGHIDKAHGIAVDSQDNVWVCDANGSTIKIVSPDGKLIKTLGVHGHRGDWNESKGQRYLWQPLAVAFGKDGDAYIGEGHANESPNDMGSDDPTNVSGAARVLHLDKDGKFINQWYGNVTGPGKFFQVHGIAVDPKNGDVWIGDREEYRLVVYTGSGQYLKTIQLRNLTCNVAFDPKGDLWVGTGGDAQLIKINRDGKVLGAVGNGPGRGDGQNGETGYMTWDKKGDMYTGSTGLDRIMEWIPPHKM